MNLSIKARHLDALKVSCLSVALFLALLSYFNVSAKVNPSKAFHKHLTSSGTVITLVYFIMRKVGSRLLIVRFDSAALYVVHGTEAITQG